MKISVIIPTYNPGPRFHTYFEKIENNLHEIKMDNEIIIIDSGTTDGGIDFLEKRNIVLIKIKPNEFNHGGTRNFAASISSGDLLVYLTQDAVLASDISIRQLILPLLNKPEVGMSYGRQLPFPNTDFFGKFAREFNYPNKSITKSLTSVNQLGIKTIFASNSFAAYKKEVLMDEIGGFPLDTIFGEDTYVAARMIKNNYSIVYVADAEVFHSHNYTIFEEFHRYFDIGVFHNKESWLLKEFSAPEGEGTKFVKSQINALLKSKMLYLLPNLVLRNGMKYIGYKLGNLEKYIPIQLKRKLSMNKRYWEHK